MLRRYALILIVTTGVGGLSSALAQAADPPVYDVYAVRYATLRDFAVANLVMGADRQRKLDIAMTVWVLKGPGGRTVLVDTGFYRPPYVNGDKVVDYTRPDKALKSLGITPDQVTDVVVTHMHWDHADGVDLFPKAQIWIQKDENLDKHVAIAQTFDAKSNLAAQDRMKKLAASSRLIIPGHDPEVFVRFPKPGNGVARLE